MTTLFYFFRLAIRNLRRGGQRIVIAWLCILLGTTVLVAMTMMAQSIQGALLIEPAQLVGGDLSLVRQSGEPVLSEHVAQLDALRRSGAISQYTLIAYNTSSIVFHTLTSGELHFIGNGMGIQPGTYPLAG
ncbi:MAG: hypothetical protein GYA17_11535, partial [Chloroflexi bacterium]|nr:hypothetical protein [Chloroflexota bacterium]